jgi:hypothetical protein
MQGPDHFSNENLAQGPPTWAAALVFSCLATGLFAAMLEVEESQFRSERDHAKLTETSYGVAEARQEDLGRFLADGRTLMIHLSTESPGLSAGAMALNESAHWGALFCDGLPALDSGKEFEIWTIAAGGEATRLGSFQPKPGVSVYQFQWNEDVLPAVRVEITAGERSGGAAVVFDKSLQ